jgi:ADP-heptose:LPS heptosyltransferase
MQGYFSNVVRTIGHYCSFWHLKRVLIFLIADFLLLAFVRRKNTDAIFILKCDLLGDYVINRNLLRSMRNYPAFQGRKVVLCANRSLKDLIQAYDGDAFDIVWIDRDQMMDNLWKRFETLRSVKRLGASLAINTIYYREPYIGDAIMRATCAKERIGRQSQHDPLDKSHRPIAFSLGDGFYTNLIAEDNSAIFEFTRTRTFLARLLPGIELGTDTRMKALSVSTPEIPSRFAVIMPGASVAFREWPPGYFAQVSQHLFRSMGIRSVILGTSGDRTKGEIIVNAAPGVPIENLCGQLTLSQMIGVIDRSTIGLTNDSGGIHIFAALDRPGLAVSCASAFGICHPYPEELSDKIAFVYPPEFYRLKLSFAQRKESYHRSEAHYPMTAITPGDVIEKMEALLQSGHYHESLLDH